MVSGQKLQRGVLGVVLVLVLTVVFSHNAWADCSDTQLRADMNARAQNSLYKSSSNIASNWQAPGSFASMYCGLNTLNGFDSLINSVGSAMAAIIRNIIMQALNQACQSAIQPIKNAASQLCIPFFTLPNMGLGLGSMKSNFCNGYQLLNVNGVFGASYGGNFTPANMSGMP